MSRALPVTTTRVALVEILADARPSANPVSKTTVPNPLGGGYGRDGLQL